MKSVFIVFSFNESDYYHNESPEHVFESEEDAEKFIEEKKKDRDLHLHVAALLKNHIDTWMNDNPQPDRPESISYNGLSPYRFEWKVEGCDVSVNTDDIEKIREIDAKNKILREEFEARLRKWNDGLARAKADFLSSPGFSWFQENKHWQHIKTSFVVREYPFTEKK